MKDRKRQLWLINHYAAAPNEAGGGRHHSLARYLHHCGWETPIIAAGTRHPSGRSRLKPGLFLRRDDHDGVPFYYIRCPEYSGSGGQRMRNMLVFPWNLLRLRNQRPVFLPAPDLVIGSSITPFAVWAAQRLAQAYRVPFVMEVRDLWPETLVSVGEHARSSPIIQAMYLLEKHLFCRARRIITLLPRMKDYVARRGIEVSKVVWISNGIDLDAYDCLRREETPFTLPRDWAFRLIYMGAMGNANDMFTLLDGFKQFEEGNEGLRAGLVLVGDGPLRERLRKYAQELGIVRIAWFDPVPRLQVPSLLEQADGCIITVKDLPALYGYGISMNKLFEYLASGRPIVIANSAVNDPVADSGGGISVSAGDVKGLGQGIEALVKMAPEKRSDMGRKGRQYAEKHYDYRHLATRLGRVLDEVYAEHNSR